MLFSITRVLKDFITCRLVRLATFVEVPVHENKGGRGHVQ